MQSVLKSLLKRNLFVIDKWKESKERTKGAILFCACEGFPNAVLITKASPYNAAFSPLFRIREEGERAIVARTLDYLRTK